MPQTRWTTWLAATLLGIGLGVAGCSPVIDSHGYAPVQEELDQIRVGQDTRGSVRRKIGRPGSTGIFTEDGWYYVATRIKRETYKEPKVLDRRVVAIRFDSTDIVSSVNQYGLSDGQVVDLVTKTTPTFGRELTVLEQALGNVGTIPNSVFEE